MMDRGNFCMSLDCICNCKEIIPDVVCENLVGNGGMCWCGYPHPTMVEWLMSYWWCWFKRWVERSMICIVALLLILLEGNERKYLYDHSNVGNNSFGPIDLVLVMFRRWVEKLMMDWINLCVILSHWDNWGSCGKKEADPSVKILEKLKKTRNN